MTKERIRSQMIINPLFPLWDKSKNEWDKKDKDAFLKLESGGTQFKKIKRKREATNAVAIIRISDGKVYSSITSCRIENGYSNAKMHALLKENILFKR